MRLRPLFGNDIMVQKMAVHDGVYDDGERDLIPANPNMNPKLISST